MEKPILIFFKIFAILVLAGILYLIRDIIVFLILALIIATAIRPGIDWLEKRRLPRFIGGILVFLLILIPLFGVFVAIIPSLISEFQSFLSNFPRYWENFLSWLPQLEKWFEGTPFGQNFRETLSQSIQRLSLVFAKTLSFAYGLGQMIFNFLFILVVAFYLAVEKNLDRKIASLFPKKEQREKCLRYFGLIQKRIGKWTQGYALSALLVGFLVYIGLSLLGVRYALILAVIGGIFEIIPLLGPLFAGFLTFILASLQGGFGLGFWSLLLFFVIQQVDNFFIIPLLMKKRVDVNPILVIISLFIGGRLAGLVGMLIAIPLVASLLAVLEEYRKERGLPR